MFVMFFELRLQRLFSRLTTMFSRTNLPAFLLASRRWGASCRSYVAAHITSKAHQPLKNPLWTTSRVLMLATATGASTFGVQHFMQDDSVRHFYGLRQRAPKYGSKREMEKVSSTFGN